MSQGQESSHAHHESLVKQQDARQEAQGPELIAQDSGEFSLFNDEEV